MGIISKNNIAAMMEMEMNLFRFVATLLSLAIISFDSSLLNDNYYNN